jgi:hypothetical protein
MSDFDTLGDHFGERCFVMVGARVFLEAECEAVHVARSAFAGERGNRRRIETRGKEQADRHIGDEVMAHAVHQRRRQPLAQFRARDPRRVVRTSQLVGDAEEALHGHTLAALDPHRGAGADRPNAPIERERLGH